MREEQTLSAAKENIDINTYTLSKLNGNQSEKKYFNERKIVHT
jgi:hypothetical protein